MIVLKRYYFKLNKIPKDVKSFLIKGLLFFIAWKFLYLLFLQPSRILDKPLTNFTAIETAKTLNSITHSASFTTKQEVDVYEEADGIYERQPVMSINYNRQQALSVADACNALELFILYAGFIICFPGNLKRKLAFIIGGILFIFLINILRCAGLAWIFIHYPQYGDFSHHYLFTFIVYLCIFLLWFWFTKKAVADVRKQ